MHIVRSALPHTIRTTYLVLNRDYSIWKLFCWIATSVPKDHSMKSAFFSLSQKTQWRWLIFTVTEIYSNLCDGGYQQALTHLGMSQTYYLTSVSLNYRSKVTTNGQGSTTYMNILSFYKRTSFSQTHANKYNLYTKKREMIQYNDCYFLRHQQYVADHEKRQKWFE